MRSAKLSAYLWAIGLAVAGAFLLLLNFGLVERFEPYAQLVVAGLIALVGVGFFGSYFADRSLWWRIIPGWTLLSVAGMVAVSTIDGADALLAPVLLFVGLAAGFTHLYFVNRQSNWWAILPGGYMLALAVVIGLYRFVDRLDWLFAVWMVGMGAVFLSLALIGPAHTKWWPLVPGISLVLFGLYVVTGGAESGSALVRWWPVSLVVVGAGLGWRAARKGEPSTRLSVNVAPGLGTAREPAIQSASNAQRSQDAGLGDYSGPAPGASVEVFTDPDRTD